MSEYLEKPYFQHGLYDGQNARFRRGDNRIMENLPKRILKLLERKYRKFSQVKRELDKEQEVYGLRHNFKFRNVLNFTCCFYREFITIAIQSPFDVFSKKRGRVIASGRMRKIIENEIDFAEPTPFWYFTKDSVELFDDEETEMN